MKKLLSIFFLLLFFSCSTINVTRIEKSESLLGFDFRKYSEKNFLITPYSYDGHYESIGLLTYSVMPEANKISEKSGRHASGQLVTTFKWEINKVSPDEAIEGVYKRCVEMGANALVDFKIASIFETYNTDPAVTIPGYEITGFAIKRK